MIQRQKKKKKLLLLNIAKQEQYTWTSNCPLKKIPDPRNKRIVEFLNPTEPFCVQWKLPQNLGQRYKRVNAERNRFQRPSEIDVYDKVDFPEEKIMFEREGIVGDSLFDDTTRKVRNNRYLNIFRVGNNRNNEIFSFFSTENDWWNQNLSGKILNNFVRWF